MRLAPLLVLAALLLGSGCSVDRDPALVTCAEDAHCPDGWWCPGTPEEHATCTEGQRPADDDDVVDDDDDVVDDDDDVVDDDDDSTLDDDDSAAQDDDDLADDDDSSAATPTALTPGGLCAAPGRSSNSAYVALHCTGPASSAPGVSSNSSFTVVAGAARLLQLPE